MVDPEKVQGLIRNLRRYTGHLHSLATLTEAEFLADPIRVGAAKYYQQVAIECCIDMANHIISTERLRAPRDYRDTFRVLNESGIIPDDLTQTLQDMASFRNRLVHLYWEVDDRQVYHGLSRELEDFETFVGYVVSLLGQST